MFSNGKDYSIVNFYVDGLGEGRYRGQYKLDYLPRVGDHVSIASQLAEDGSYAGGTGGQFRIVIHGTVTKVAYVIEEKGRREFEYHLIQHVNVYIVEE